MKRPLLSIVCLLAAIVLQAKEVSVSIASSKALAIMKERVAGFDASVSSVTPVSHNGVKAYYVVQLAPQGWVLISADDTTEPLIGYSADGQYSVDNQSETMRSVMECYATRIVDRARHLSHVATGWETKSAAAMATRATTSDNVEPLIKVKWNQSGSYKKYCPSNSQGQAIVGCVAVAMAQAMSVARWPLHASGEYSYTDPTYGTQYINYDNEPAYDWDDIIAGNNNKDGAARLLWHCGVSVNMQYGVSGSGTQDSYIATALKRNFSYPSSVRYVKRSSYDGDWNELILNELKNGRAVCLSGQDLKNGYGHCFNLDGYSNGAYHVNWGWGGSNNGYFELNALKDLTMNMDYSNAAYQSVIVGIRQPSDKPSDIVLSNYSVAEGQAVGTVVGSIEVENEATTTPTYTYSVLGAYSAVFHRRLPAPFEVKDGSLVTTEVLKASDGNRNITITATDQNGASVSRDFTIKVTSADAVETVKAGKSMATEHVYGIDGKRRTATCKGINIIKRTSTDGTHSTTKSIVR